MTIETPRLLLVTFPPEFLRAGLVGDLRHAALILGYPQANDWPVFSDTYQRRLDQLIADPLLQPWLLRGMILRATGQLIGQIGFHTGPDPDYLAGLAPGGIELGYTVFAPYRRQGFAGEAITALMNWAGTQHEVTRFVISVSPENAPSLALATKFGFRRIGEHMDEVDGLEHIFLLDAKTSI